MNEEKIVELTLPYQKNQKLIRVYIPKHEPDTLLPVIYMTDGQNLFEEERCAFGCWHVREAIREEAEKTGKAAVVVGIFNDQPQQRFRELTPASIGNIIFPNPFVKIIVNLFAKPQAEAFDEFLIHTVKPYVEAAFPVRTDRAGTAFCGSSSGGLFSFFTALSHPDIFSYAGVFSPAFTMYSKESWETWLLSERSEELPFLYLYMGNGDQKEQELYPGFLSVCELLQMHYPNEMIQQVIRADAIHHEKAWEPVFRDFLHLFLA